MPDVPIISIIDDDDSMRCAMKSLVTSLGLRVHTFRSAEEFLQSPRLDDTSCLITDLQMPGLSGVELQSLLLAQARHMPIILVTAFPEEPTRNRVMEAGALFSYGVNLVDIFRDVAAVVDQVARLGNAGEIPMRAPSHFHTAVNLKTANALGLQIPDRLLALADEVIE